VNKNSTPPEIEVRHCHSLAEYDECVRLELSIWGEAIAVPIPIFVVANHTGGHILGAFHGSRLIGFTMALAGLREGPQQFLHSHMTAVLPEYQNFGVGRRLKLYQRWDALRQGIRLVEWTFDPLELKNAYFNIARLGAIMCRYIPNCYGVTDSPLHGGLPTDRLVAEWWLDSERVNSLLAGNALPISKAERIPVPTNISELKASDHAAAARVQAETGERFQHWFSKSYFVTSLESRGDTTDYILEPAASIAGLRSRIPIQNERPE
jgi:predicted GNAT superfamily acetyltransferase